MSETLLASIDIGSTYTKGALFARGADTFRLLARAETPTTVENLADCFKQVLAAILVDRQKQAEIPIYLSSSARGGLKIAAIGLTTDLTLSIARMAAYSAGGKIVRTYAYELTTAEVADLEKLFPDIILFTGGTDGGNSSIVLKNAQLLGKSKIAAFIIYAGNKKITDDVLHLLDDKEVVTTDNVMPAIGTIQIEPVREVIRKVFLDHIVEGKGLSHVVRKIGRDPWPTPLAVFELIREIGVTQPDWSNTGVIDLGGATTDFYSYTEAFAGGDSVVLRGLQEPLLKRTVEGDLGLRVSASALWESQQDYLISRMVTAGLSVAAFTDYIRAISEHPESQPGNDTEAIYDDMMASACIRAAAHRHAGTLSRVYTPDGWFHVQRGKDLRRITRLIGTGGYLSRVQNAALLLEACKPCIDKEESLLLPEKPECYADEGYLIPLLANFVPDYPEVAARTVVHGLRKLDKADENGNRIDS